jgi:hypothetical protein
VIGDAFIDRGCSAVEVDQPFLGGRIMVLFAGLFAFALAGSHQQTPKGCETVACAVEVRNVSPYYIEVVSNNLVIGTLAPHETQKLQPSTLRGSLQARFVQGGGTASRYCLYRGKKNEVHRYDCPRTP